MPCSTSSPISAEDNPRSLANILKRQDKLLSVALSPVSVAHRSTGTCTAVRPSDLANVASTSSSLGPQRSHVWDLAGGTVDGTPNNLICTVDHRSNLIWRLDGFRLPRRWLPMLGQTRGGRGWEQSDGCITSWLFDSESAVNVRPLRLRCQLSQRRFSASQRNNIVVIYSVAVEAG